MIRSSPRFQGETLIAAMTADPAHVRHARPRGRLLAVALIAAFLVAFLVAGTASLAFAEKPDRSCEPVPHDNGNHTGSTPKPDKCKPCKDHGNHLGVDNSCPPEPVIPEAATPALLAIGGAAAAGALFWRTQRRARTG